MALLALIPARGGSKGIHRKNIKDFCGKPLIGWSIDIAAKCPEVDRIVVSTDDPEIADVAREFGAEVPFLRPKELAEDSSPGIDVVLHALEMIPECSEVLLLQPTSPLRKRDDLSEIVSLLRSSGEESAVSVTEESKGFYWSYKMTRQGKLEQAVDVESPSGRQQMESIYRVNGSLYIATRSFLSYHRSFISNDTLAYVMPKERAVDIDTPLDWLWGEFLFDRTA